MIGGMALLFSALLYLIPIRGNRPESKEPFEVSIDRLRHYLREIRRDQDERDREDI
jgi:hypothetical protein